MTLSSRPKRRQEERTAAFVEQAAAVDTEQLHCLIPADLHRRLRVTAAEDRTTITNLVVALQSRAILQHVREPVASVLCTSDHRYCNALHNGIWAMARPAGGRSHNPGPPTQ